MKSASERWYAYFDGPNCNGEADYDEALKSFGQRGDGALVIFDDEGWFVLRKDPTTRQIFAEGPDGVRCEIYCEPIWLTGFREDLPNLFYNPAYPEGEQAPEADPAS